MFEYTYTAKEKLGLDGTVVEPDTVVATIRTEHPIDNILSAIRVHAVACERKKLPEPVVETSKPPAKPDAVKPGSRQGTKETAATAARK